MSVSETRNRRRQTTQSSGGMRKHTELDSSDAPRTKKKIKSVQKASGGSTVEAQSLGTMSWVASLNCVLGLVVMVTVGYCHQRHMYQLHENNLWFTNIKEVEREISFRTEAGLYYSYYKQILQAPSLLQGVEILTRDNLTESPSTINVLQRMNVYQEVILAFLYRTLPFIHVPPIFFYTYTVFALHGLLVAALYAVAWLLSGSWLTGLLTAAFYMANRLDTTRVIHTAPLREQFSLPFLWLQAAAITLYLRPSVSYGLQRVSLLCVWVSTMAFCLFWQFNQFIMMLQAFTLFGVWVLGVIPACKVRPLVWCQLSSLLLVSLLQFGNTMILASLAVAFCTGFLVVTYMFKDHLASQSVLLHAARVCGLSALTLVLMVVISSGVKVLLDVDSDEHIFKFLQNKFGVGDERDFDSRLYLCLGVFGFITRDVFERMIDNLVLPFYVPAHLAMLAALAYSVIRRWRSATKPSEALKGSKVSSTDRNTDCMAERPDLVFHTVQAVFFGGLAMLTLRMKYFWTPYVCVLAAIAIGDARLWAKMLSFIKCHNKYWLKIVRSVAVLLVLVILLGKTVPPALRELENLSEFWDPDTVELMEWISANTSRTASFTGSMQLLAGVKLCTGRPITNHPHYEDKWLRHKTKQLYQIYGRRSPEEVHAILTKHGSNYIILEDSICRAYSRGGCRLPDLVDVDNGVMPDDAIDIPGLVQSKVPRFCERVRHQEDAYKKYFPTVLVNKTFRVYKVMQPR